MRRYVEVVQKKYVYDFNEGDAGMKMLLGGKGANLAQMCKIGLPVPPGLIITTEACKSYWEQGAGLLDVAEGLDEVRLGRHRRAGDQKIVFPPLGLNAVIGVRRNLFLAQEIFFNTIVCAHCASCVVVIRDMPAWSVPS